MYNVGMISKIQLYINVLRCEKNKTCFLNDGNGYDLLYKR